MAPGHCNSERAGGARGRAQWERIAEGFKFPQGSDNLPGNQLSRDCHGPTYLACAAGGRALQLSPQETGPSDRETGRSSGTTSC